MILSLNCLFLGEAPIRSIPVLIDDAITVGNSRIKYEKITISNVKSLILSEKRISRCLDNLNLWKVNLVIVNENDKVLEISCTEDDIKEKFGGELMNPQSSLGEYFNENSFKDEGSKSAIHIIVWETNMPNEPEAKFTNIPAEGDNLTKLTAGESNRFWGEDLGRPLKDHTHIIIDSPALVLKQELQNKDNGIDKLRGELEKKHHADSTVKSELKYDVDLSETLNRLSMTEKKSQSYIGDQEILPITGTGMLPQLVTLSKFWSTYIKDAPLSYMNPGIVNGEPAIIAYVHVPKGTPVELPAEFEGYPVFMDYGAIEPACYKSPVALSPGISIGSISACTLGALFKNETKTGKSFILTTKHSVENTDSMVIQPGSSDAEKGYTICAKVSKYNFYGVIYEHGDALLLDYAFCEVINSEVVFTNNTPGFCISNTKDFVSGLKNKYEISKVGRTTNYTEGVVEDKLENFFNRKFGYVKTLVIRRPKERFGAPGDSGSPVFDKHNTLWGILQGISSDGSTASVVPIHLILQHVQREFGVSFKLI